MRGKNAREIARAEYVDEFDKYSRTKAAPSHFVARLALSNGLGEQSRPIGTCKPCRTASTQICKSGELVRHGA